MKFSLFADSPGLVFAAGIIVNGGLSVRGLDYGLLEREQRVAKLVTGSPSLLYEIQIESSEIALADMVVEFGLDVEGGVVLFDGYDFDPSELSRRSVVLQVRDGYYRVRVASLPVARPGVMVLSISLAATSNRLATQGADLDYLPP